MAYADVSMSEKHKTISHGYRADGDNDKIRSSPLAHVDLELTHKGQTAQKLRLRFASSEQNLIEQQRQAATNDAETAHVELLRVTHRAPSGQVVASAASRALHTASTQTHGQSV